MPDDGAAHAERARAESSCCVRAHALRDRLVGLMTKLRPIGRYKSSQVKSSQVKFTVANPPPLVPIAGASDREGRSRRNRHHWIAPSRGIIPIVLFLIIARAPGLQLRAFLRKSTVLYSNAKPIQADDGSDRGTARGLFRWAKASVGSGDRRRRASSARGPSPTSFRRFGPDKGTSIILVARHERLARRRQSDRGQ